jgi:hypothetical protein
MKADAVPPPHSSRCGRTVVDEEAFAAAVKHLGRNRRGTTGP